MTTIELELWYNLLEEVMLRMILIAHTAQVGPVLNKEDCALIRSEKSLSTDEIEGAVDDNERLSPTRTVTLRLAFRAYLAREFWSDAFKFETARKILEQEEPQIAKAKRALLLNLPALFSDEFVAAKADQFIEDWGHLSDKARRP